MRAASLFLILFMVSTQSWSLGGLLDFYDYEVERRDSQNGPALSSTMDSDIHWASHSQWQCFSTTDIEYSCVIYDTDTKVPSMSVQLDELLHLFDVHVEDQFDCKATLAEWKKIASGGHELCIYAAHMPAVDFGDDLPSTNLWYINRVKGYSGVWPPDSDSPVTSF